MKIYRIAKENLLNKIYFQNLFGYKIIIKKN